MTSVSKLTRLRLWIDVDETNRGYSGMTDRQVAQDLQTEMVSRGGVSRWDLLDDVFGSPAARSEYANQHDGDPAAEGANAEGSRSRIASFMAFLGVTSDQRIPGEHYNTVKRFAGQTFGPSSTIHTNISNRLDRDEETRARWLSFGRRNEDELTEDVTKARALPSPTIETTAQQPQERNGRRRSR